MKLPNSTSTFLPWMLVGLLVVVLVTIFLLRSRPTTATGPGTDGQQNQPSDPISTSSQQTDPPPTDPPPTKRPETLIEELAARHAAENDAAAWNAILADWDALAQRDDLTEPQQDVIAKHRANARQALAAAQQTEQTVKLPADDPERKRPPATPQADFLRYYPAGKKIRSAAFFNIDGRGRNARWIWQEMVHFSYLYHVVVETTVQENTGTYAIFELQFRDVSQIRATAKEEISLRPRGSGTDLWNLVWGGADSGLLMIPHYRVIKYGARAIELVDPRFKRIMTLVKQVVESAGGRAVADREDVEIAAQVEALAGRRLQVTYVRDLGVTEVTMLDDGPVPHDEMKQLAYNSSLLMDYFVFPGGQQKEGERWSVDAREVSGLVNLELDVEASGLLTIQRGPQRTGDGDEAVVELQVVSGEVQAVYQGKLGPQTTTIRPQGGTILYSPAGLLIREAALQWEMEKIEVSQDHLLFGTEKAQDVSVQSHYVAKRIDEFNLTKPGDGQ